MTRINSASSFDNRRDMPSTAECVAPIPPVQKTINGMRNLASEIVERVSTLRSVLEPVVSQPVPMPNDSKDSPGNASCPLEDQLLEVTAIMLDANRLLRDIQARVQV